MGPIHSALASLASFPASIARISLSEETGGADLRVEAAGPGEEGGDVTVMDAVSLAVGSPDWAPARVYSS